MTYVLNSPQFSVFLKFYQYLWSEFSKITDKFVYLEAMETVQVLLTSCSFVTLKTWEWPGDEASRNWDSAICGICGVSPVFESGLARWKCKKLYMH